MAGAPGRPARGLLHSRVHASSRPTAAPRRTGASLIAALPAREEGPDGRRQRPGQADHLLPRPRHARALEALRHRRRAAVAAGLRGRGLLATRSASLDAPTPEQDPDWSPEDVTINVIRWVPQEHVNAMGPHVVDPRSGETLSAHIQVWPQVIDGFGQYY
ncbi:MAG: hypothetical protein MZV63_27070 [Marinilabiliales bacterium]|nr:hypothetical protein [Marinilabiliales bacterium]